MDRRIFLKAGGLAATSALFSTRLLATPTQMLPRVAAALDRHGSAISSRDIVGIADFSTHSSRPRFHLLDMGNGRISSLLVAHGRGSDPGHTGWVQRFSNLEGSNASCAGAFRTDEAYIGQHGRSRRLQGLEPENDAAMARAIVIHGANYVSAARAASGPIGRSFGCFAFAQEDIAQVLERLGPGRLLLAYKA